jgi:hypothetical protein
MPLDPSRLANGIRDLLIADAEHSQAVAGEALDALCSAIATAVVLELTVNAMVLPLLLVAPPGGGPVTGTGKIQ